MWYLSNTGCLTVSDCICTDSDAGPLGCMEKCCTFSLEGSNTWFVPLIRYFIFLQDIPWDMSLSKQRSKLVWTAPVLIKSIEICINICVVVHTHRYMHICITTIYM